MTTEITDVEDAGTWRGNIEKIFIDIMVNEVNKGNMDSGTFSTNTWRRILLEVNSQGKRNFNLKQLKQKFNRLRAMHREFSDLLKHTGFGWDAETNTVHALEETWQNYIRAHPNAKRFRSKGCPNYNLLGLIFNPSTATGALHYSSTQDPPNTDDEDEMDDNLEHGGVHVDVDTEIPDDPPQPEMAGGVTTRSGKRVTDSLLERRGNALKAWVEASKARTETSRARTEALLARVDRYKSGTSSEATSGGTTDFSITRCMAALQTIELLDNDKYLKAVEKFTMPEWREIFMNMPDERKMDTRFVTVEEAVAMFLLIVGHNVRMRVVADRFQHSTETVARHFKEVRRALCRLGKILICPNNMTNEVSSYVASNPKYFPWFKDCIGAIDGTHISAWVPADRQTSFRGTKRCTCLLDALTRPKSISLAKMMPCYKPSRQPSIVVACCTLHNWIRLSTRNDQLFREYEVEDLSIEGEEESTKCSTMATCRDQIAEVMWANYINVNP
ncbi:hypothetical protein AAG906_035235 [Vitis piasezkii]